MILPVSTSPERKFSIPSRRCALPKPGSRLTRARIVSLKSRVKATAVTFLSLFAACSLARAAPPAIFQGCDSWLLYASLRSLRLCVICTLPFRSTFKGAIMPHEVSMFDIKKDIQAMTTFRRNPGEFMKRLKKTKRPLILTVNGKAEAVVHDAEAYQRLLDIAAQADAVEGIRQGLEDVKKGRMRPAREVLEMFRRIHEIPR